MIISTTKLFEIMEWNNRLDNMEEYLTEYRTPKDKEIEVKKDSLDFYFLKPIHEALERIEENLPKETAPDSTSLELDVLAGRIAAILEYYSSYPPARLWHVNNLKLIISYLQKGWDQSKGIVILRDDEVDEQIRPAIKRLRNGPPTPATSVQIHKKR